MVHCQLWEGKQHRQEGTPQFLHGVGGVQHSPVVRPRGTLRAAQLADPEENAAGKESLPLTAAERDPELNVLGGEVDAARQPLAAVVLAEQPMGCDVALVVSAFLWIGDRTKWIRCLWKRRDWRTNVWWWQRWSVRKQACRGRFLPVAVADDRFVHPTACNHAAQAAFDLRTAEAVIFASKNGRGFRVIVKG